MGGSILLLQSNYGAGKLGGFAGRLRAYINQKERHYEK
jgi:hypothetical protein